MLLGANEVATIMTRVAVWSICTNAETDGTAVREGQAQAPGRQAHRRRANRREVKAVIPLKIHQTDELREIAAFLRQRLQRARWRRSFQAQHTLS